MKKSPLYTRTGDRGMTSLVDGTRVRKNSPRVSAYGTLDELNAMVGLLQAHCTTLTPNTTDNSDSSNPSDNSILYTLNSTLSTLNSILSTLFDIGAYLATPDKEDNSILYTLNSILSKRLADLEHQIDLLDSLVPPLRLFVLPGGSIPAAHAHVARTVCRRAERDILTLADTGAHVDPTVLTYINRLSDYLFILARYLNHLTSTPELTWHP